MVRVGAATPRWAIGADNRTVVDAIIVEIGVWGACGGDRVRARESADGRGRVVRQGGSARPGARRHAAGLILYGMYVDLGLGRNVFSLCHVKGTSVDHDWVTIRNPSRVLYVLGSMC